MDGVRAIAVLLVIIFHCWEGSGMPLLLVSLPLINASLNLTPIASSGFIGVQLFFVLSGFLLAQYWLNPSFQGRPRPSTRQYFRQRLFRIAPAYYCCLFLVLLLLVPGLIPAADVYSGPGVFTLGAHLFFAQLLFPVSASSYGVEGSFWTLSIEVLFYLMLPLVIWCFSKTRWKYFLCASVVLSLSWFYLTRNSLDPLVQFYEHQTPGATLTENAARFFLSIQFPTHAATFALGISLANIYTQFQLKLRTDRLFRLLTSNAAGLMYLFVGVALELFLMYAIFPKDTLANNYSYWTLIAFGFTLILAGVLFGGQCIRAALSVLPLRFIGVVSYSMYLWHLPIMFLFKSLPIVATLPSPDRFPLHFGMTFLVALFLATGSYLAIEKPFMLLGRQHKLAKKAATGAPQEAAPALAVSSARVLINPGLLEPTPMPFLESPHAES
ncbi:MAG TPA: acyltransferase [Ktedonobacterales bacterium]|nr:acyltransferase [Ktedonobacterales bacterium]